MHYIARSTYILKLNQAGQQRTKQLQVHLADVVHYINISITYTSYPIRSYLASGFTNEMHF